MSERDSFFTPLAATAGDGIGPVGAQLHSPRQNHILAALPAQDYQRLLPGLEPVVLPAGRVLYRPGDRQRRLYFITAGIVSRQYVSHLGLATEFAITGAEGVIGVASFLGGEPMPSQAVVVAAGHAWQLDAALVMKEFDGGGALQQLLLRYTLALINQTGQIAVCNRQHSVEQRLCRWLLSCLDRLPSNHLALTHDLIADVLGVRRPGVTLALGTLEQAGLVKCGRGHITVLERQALQARACECYQMLRQDPPRSSAALTSRPSSITDIA